MNIQSYSLKKVTAFIESLVSTGNYKPGDRLPSTRTMARQLSVSRDTIREAVAVFTSQKKLHIRKNKGIYIPLPDGKQFPLSSPQKAEKSNQSHTVWEQVQTRMKEDILNGVFVHEKFQRIPSIKELKNRYNASYKPIKKAIISLQKSKLISEDGSTGIEVFSRGKSLPTIILITSIGFGKIESVSDREYLFLRLLESECKKVNINLILIFYSNDLLKEITNRVKSISLRGFIIYCYTKAQNLTSATLLKHFNVPLAMVDMGGDFNIPPAMTNQVFTFGSILSAGSEMARLLLASGHKKIAFISCIHSGEYSQKRFISLRETFESAHDTNKVVLFEVQDLVPAHEQITPLSKNKTYSQMMDGLQQLKAFVQQEGHLVPSTFGLEAVIPKVSRENSYYYTLLPLFHKALTDPTITAWVCADDLMAIPALYFLKKNGKRVPDDISVAGFEDIFETLAVGLTTYNFNVPALVARCMRFIRYPKEKFGPRGNRPIEIAGNIIERQTTGPAPLI